MYTQMMFSIILLQTLSQKDAKVDFVETGIASMYEPWRKSKFVPYAKYAATWKIQPTKDDYVCAHRKIPFWTLLRLTNLKTNRYSYCILYLFIPQYLHDIPRNRSHSKISFRQGYCI